MKVNEVPQLSNLVERVSEAVEFKDPHVVTLKVKDALEELILSRSIILPSCFQQSEADRYARRLLYEDEKTGFVIVAMTWGPGQKTALHDHSGVWCVEGVIQGQMRVDQFEKKETKNDKIRFVHRGHIMAEVGNSGALIPPFEHHILSNALSKDVSMTIHVYGSNITRCAVYTLVKDDWFKEETCKLEYQV